MKKTVYGIKTMSLNGHNIYSWKLRVSYSNFNISEVVNNYLPHYVSVGKNNKEMINLTFVTMDPDQFLVKKRDLVKVLHKIAQNNLDDKYRNMGY
jgi:hypothetical protein